MIPHSRPTLGPEERKAIEEVLESGQIAQGKKVSEFERVLTQYTGRHYAIAVSSGTSALHLSLLGLEISKGDEIIIPSFTCVALLHAIDAVGARPVLSDIDLEDFNISVAEVKKKIRRKTKAVIVPHAFGRASRMYELSDLKIPVIEDGTQALGASIGGKKVGSFGTVSVFSFYATKMITTGEGGMILTDSRRLAEKLHDLRDYDKKKIYQFRTNSKMTDLEAAMGIVQMKKLPSFIQRRREIAFRFKEAFQDSKYFLPSEDKNHDHIYYRYVIRIPKKSKDWIRRMRNRGIDIKEPIFKPLHRYLNLSNSQFSHTAQAFKECCSLPIFPSLNNEECDQICQTIREESFQEVSCLR